MPYTTIGRAESGSHTPRIETFVAALEALGYRLIVVDRHGRPLVVDEDHERLRDAEGRHFPAHLEAGRTPGYFDLSGYWWGWHHIAWHGVEDRVLEHTYWRRSSSREYAARLQCWDDAT